MTPLAASKLRYFLQLGYPLQIVANGHGYRGWYPDLPGVEATAEDLEVLRLSLEQLRQSWLMERVQAGDTPPLPNSYLEQAG